MSAAPGPASFDPTSATSTITSRWSLEEVAAQRDLLTTVLEANTAVISVEQNLISVRQSATMERLTILATVFLPLTFVTGFFGQNFDWLTHVQNFAAFLRPQDRRFADPVRAPVCLVPAQRHPRGHPSAASPQRPGGSGAATLKQKASGINGLMINGRDSPLAPSNRRGGAWRAASAGWGGVAHPGEQALERPGTEEHGRGDQARQPGPGGYTASDDGEHGHPTSTFHSADI